MGVPLVNKSMINETTRSGGGTLEPGHHINRSFAFVPNNQLSSVDLSTPRMGNARNTRMSFSKQPSLQQINERVRGGGSLVPPRIPKVLKPNKALMMSGR